MSFNQSSENHGEDSRKGVGKRVIVLSFSVLFCVVLWFVLSAYNKRDMENKIIDLVNNQNYTDAFETMKIFDNDYEVPSDDRSKGEIIVSRELIDDLTQIKKILQSNKNHAEETVIALNSLTIEENELLLKEKLD
jgi:hypothetical protein